MIYRAFGVGRFLLSLCSLSIFIYRAIRRRFYVAFELLLMSICSITRRFSRQHINFNWCIHTIMYSHDRLPTAFFSATAETPSWVMSVSKVTYLRLCLTQVKRTFAFFGISYVLADSHSGGVTGRDYLSFTFAYVCSPSAFALRWCEIDVFTSR